MNNTRVTINISGMIFETYLSTLENFPKTLLGCADKRQNYYSQEKDEYFFNRNRKAFDAILYYYQSKGKLKRPENVPMNIFIKEVNFFELGKEVTDKMLENEGYLAELSATSPRRVLQREIWKIFEPRQSRTFTAKMVGYLSMLFVLLSIVLSVLQSLPTIQNQRRLKSHIQFEPWFITELVLNSWFALEYVLRLYASQNRLSFIISPLNMAEAAVTFPFFIICSITSSTQFHTTTSVAALRVVRIARVFRMFKFSHFSQSLRVIKHCLIESMAKLGYLLLFLFIIITVSSSFLFYVEMDDRETQITSIPVGMWFTLQTVTTIGYGDIVPATTLGKLSAAICAIFGAFTLTLPVLSFVTRFNNLYYINMECSIRQNRLRRSRKSISSKNSRSTSSSSTSQ